MDALTYDIRRETLREREVFSRIRQAEHGYAVELRKVAKHIDDLIRGLRPRDQVDVDMLRRILERYAELLRPWAHSVARRMLMNVERRDYNAWVKYSRMMGVELRRELNAAPTGMVMRELMDQQVTLITSLPLDAAQRVHELALENITTGVRAADLAQKIMETGEVTRARANTIARTETGRAATSLTQARAQHIGSPGYIWRSAGDYKVRPEIGIRNFARLNTLEMGSHRKLNGTFHAWSDPPIAAPTGERAHPGAIWNCRCYPEPVIPDGL